MTVSETQAILLVHGPDRKGIVAAFSQTLFGHGCGIVSSEQHTDAESSVFYQRIVFDAAELHTDRVSLERGIEEVAGRLGMTCEVRWPKPKRVAIFVSKYAHCLWELLLRHDAGELPGVEIVQIVSNHEDLRHVAEHFSVPYAVFKVTKDTKRAVAASAETRILRHRRYCAIDATSSLARWRKIESHRWRTRSSRSSKKSRSTS